MSVITITETTNYIKTFFFNLYERAKLPDSSCDDLLYIVSQTGYNFAIDIEIQFERIIRADIIHNLRAAIEYKDMTQPSPSALCFRLSELLTGLIHDPHIDNQKITDILVDMRKKVTKLYYLSKFAVDYYNNHLSSVTCTNYTDIGTINGTLHLSDPISRLREFGVSHTSCLELSGIRVVGDLYRYNYEALLKLRGVGKRTIDNIDDALKRNNLTELKHSLED